MSDEPRGPRLRLPRANVFGLSIEYNDGRNGVSIRSMEGAETKTVEVVVNGVTRRVPEGFSLDRLLVWLELDPARVAVERNLAIVRKTDWRTTQISAGDRLEIVWFVGGG